MRLGDLHLQIKRKRKGQGNFPSPHSQREGGPLTELVLIAVTAVHSARQGLRLEAAIGFSQLPGPTHRIGAEGLLFPDRALPLLLGACRDLFIVSNASFLFLGVFKTFQNKRTLDGLKFSKYGREYQKRKGGRRVSFFQFVCWTHFVTISHCVSPHGNPEWLLLNPMPPRQAPGEWK